MELTKKEKEVAYSLLSNVSDTTNREREFELQGTVKMILTNRFSIEEIQNMKIICSNGTVEIAPKTVL